MSDSLEPLRKYADFTGRASRREYWMFYLVQMGFLTAGGFALIAARVLQSKTMSVLVLLALGLGCLGLVLPQIALSVRRLHDTNKSALMLLINFVPFVGPIIFIVLMCLASDAANRYGPPPVQ